jgi:hypothetical protein
MQPIGVTSPRYSYDYDSVELAVLPVSSYDQWWRRQIGDKTRNLVRKSAKLGVEVRTNLLDEAFVAGVKAIYDESPTRQGKRFTHFGKPLETLHRELATFAEETSFLGAFADGNLIGFAKLVRHDGIASLMHIIARIDQRAKAPANALVAKPSRSAPTRGSPPCTTASGASAA